MRWVFSIDLLPTWRMQLAKSKPSKPRQKFFVSPELMEWIEDVVLDHMRHNDDRAYWTELQRLIYYEAPKSVHSKEWTRKSNYAHAKALNTVLDNLSNRSVIYRLKNYRPYVLVNPLDRIVEALEQDNEPAAED